MSVPGVNGPVPWLPPKTADIERQLFVAMIETCETLLDYVADKCDEPLHPAWCCNHQRKQCTGTVDVAKARALLAQIKEL